MLISRCIAAHAVVAFIGFLAVCPRVPKISDLKPRIGLETRARVLGQNGRNVRCSRRKLKHCQLVVTVRQKKKRQTGGQAERTDKHFEHAFGCEHGLRNVECVQKSRSTLKRYSDSSFWNRKS